MIVNAINPIMNAPVGWVGGKSMLRSTLYVLMAPHNTYCEVFTGSGTIFFGKKPSNLEFLNDLNADLVNLMMVLSGTYFDKSVRDEFVSYVRQMPSSRHCYQSWQKMSKEEINKLSHAQRAFRYYYCVKNGFSSMVDGGYAASPHTRSRYNMNTEFDKFSKRFRESNAHIECMDFRDFIDKYNKNKSDSFFICDPPYFVANGTNYYEHCFSDTDHNDLFLKCVEIDKVGNKFLITYDDVDNVLNLYNKFFIYRTDPLLYSASNESSSRKIKKPELIITNYCLHDLIANKKKSLKSRDIFSQVEYSCGDQITVNGGINVRRV